MRLIEPSSPFSRRPLRLLLTAALMVPPVLHAQSSSSDLARAELQRRANAVSEAQELIKQGDEAYEAARYAEASTAYRGALDLMPAGAPVIAAQREATLQRYVQASVEEAKELRRFGNLEAANAAVERVLVDDLAPDAPEALAMREQLADPIRTNPASSPEHTADIEEVRLLLYKADGAFMLGKLDEAKAVYEDVLQVDSTNSAARRGMEKVAAAKSDYYRAAYDQTRAEMLSMVDAEWELSLPPVGDLGTAGDYRTNVDTSTYIDKLSRIVLPIVVMDDITLPEAIDFIRQRAIELDTFELDPAKRGINIVLDLGGPDSEVGNRIREKRFNLNLRNVPLKELIGYLTEATGTVALEQPFALVLRPAGADSPDMVVKTYRVPPDFLTSGGSGGDDGGADLDPFAQQPDQGALPRRLTAEQVLKDRGVSFPEGASANFNAATSTLRVRNTMTNHSLVDQVVDLLANEEPTAVIVDVKMIKTTQSRLEELSFDWLLGDFGFGSEGGVPGVNKGFLTGGTQGNGGDLGDIPVPLAFANSARPVTAGNRSGPGAIANNSIDDLLSGGGRGFGASSARAPGALWVNGQFNSTQVSMLMRGLDQKTGIDLAAVPSVTTRSGQAASVRVTREFIYPTEYEPPELPNQVGGTLVDLDTGELVDQDVGIVPVTPATPTSFEMREVGIVLDVLPTVSQDKSYVDISIKPDITDFDGFINYGTPILAGQTTTINPNPVNLGGLFQTSDVVITPNEILMPVFSKIGTETSLTVADKATVVIGGLLEERSQNVEDKTPILGDIPVVGRLFQSKASRPVKTAIIFLVTVRVVDGAGRPFNP
ncbi:Amuc_1098 family type IV pilus outer membrane protein [Haloferula rosea]|uniref:Type II/III secretion system secretin-like domain-containing protein n=1 Tax=Haloferula rosea TaxID=490093 RepID=A0A934VD30_9BACT|nr:Amuc_1098 family type IV pilus outer membrane protein [Haloferula rosea]MBK1825859.1 hypothetical protein [Haloferula rosea]